MTSKKPKGKMQKANPLAGVFFGILLALGLAQAVQVWVPASMSGAVGDTALVPILVSGQVGKNVIAADVTLSFGEAVLTATGGNIVGNTAPGSIAYTNPFPCSLLVAMVGVSPLGAGDTLLLVKMLADMADTTTVWFSRCRLNEGNVPCTTQAGKFHGGPPGIQETGSLVPSSQFSVWPNPVTRFAWVSLAVGNRSQARVSVRDVSGHPVRVLFDGVADATEQRLFWDCGDDRGKRVPAGVYFCTLSTENHCFSRKVILTE